MATSERRGFAQRARGRVALLVGGLAGLGVVFGVAAWALHGTRPGAAPAPTTPPNIVMIVIDTLRADQLGAYGNPRGLTPFLDALAARGTVFTNASATSSWTCPSVASLFTSRYATQHGVHGFASQLADEERTLAEALDDAGYRSAGFTANFRLTTQLGYAQGFAFWSAYMPPADPERPITKVRGGRLRAAAERWLTTTGVLGGPAPIFLYLQLMETHAPYDPPQPFRERFAGAVDDASARAAHEKLLRPIFGMKQLRRDELNQLRHLYAGEVASADAELALLFERLEALGVLRDALIIVTADHGEEFGEHGQMLHGWSLYEPAVHVPLLLVGPGVPAGVVDAEPVSLLDLAPTVLALAGLPPEPSFEGRAFLPERGGASAPGAHPHGVISELERVNPTGFDARMHVRSLRDGVHKVLVTPRGALEIYDLSSDPRETRPLTGADAIDAAASLAPLDAHRSALAARQAPPRAEAVALDEATKEKLRALGYHD